MNSCSSTRKSSVTPCSYKMMVATATIYLRAQLYACVRKHVAPATSAGPSKGRHKAAQRIDDGDRAPARRQRRVSRLQARSRQRVRTARRGSATTGTLRGTDRGRSHQRVLEQGRGSTTGSDGHCRRYLRVDRSHGQPELACACVDDGRDLEVFEQSRHLAMISSRWSLTNSLSMAADQSSDARIWRSITPGLGRRWEECVPRSPPRWST